MPSKSPKYSIIIPSRNGLKYLPFCIETIINQNYANYELIISDDHSEDGTKYYLTTLKHKNIIILEPPVSLSMSEHWEWALSYSKGEWIIFVGQDDGLQSYFFKLADKLTNIAKEKNIRTIMSERAYFFWPGCEFLYGDRAIRYCAQNRVKLHNCFLESLKVLFGIQTYFELPEMYTTSLFNRDLIDEVKAKQQGKVIVTHPQDANLAAIACSLEKYYLKSSIPLGWVGSSPKSAGFAISTFNLNKVSTDDISKMKPLKNEYENKIKNSVLSYLQVAGDFAFENYTIYYWQAILHTQCLRKPIPNKFYNSGLLKFIMFIHIYLEVKYSKLSSVSLRLPMFKHIVHINSFSYGTIVFIAESIRPIVNLIQFIVIYFNKIIQRTFGKFIDNQYIYHLNWHNNQSLNMLHLSNEIEEILKNKNWI
jgi:glycosyltransferase involved in cell wall biosynthesis